MNGLGSLLAVECGAVRIFLNGSAIEHIDTEKTLFGLRTMGNKNLVDYYYRSLVSPDLCK